MTFTFALKHLGRLVFFQCLACALVAGAQTASPAPSPQSDPNAIRVLVSPDLETTLVSQMAGRILTLNASLGVAVGKGRSIVVFDCGELTAKAQMADAEYAAAKETLETKTKLRDLEAAGATEVALAVAASDRAKAAIAVSKAQLGQCSVEAPFSGRIVKIHVKPHQGVNAGSPLVEMVSNGALKLRLNVPSKLLRTLRTGTSFEVDIDETGKTYQARVSAINARVDSVAQTVELEGRLATRPSELLAGMTGVARFASKP